MRPSSSRRLLLLHPVILLFWAWLPLPCSGFQPGKAGYCPELQNEDEMCGMFCSLNGICPGNQRCCRTLCGQFCALPETDNGGYCPRVDPSPYLTPTCIPDCNVDEDCVGEMAKMKCCSYGCQKKCVVAIAEHPGLCPLKEEVKTNAPCNNTCSDDGGCAFHEKCCFDGCALSCMDSVRSKKCRFPSEKGRCMLNLTRYYYNTDKKICETFSYGGCQGNSNNFKSLAACNKSCGQITPDRKTSGQSKY